VDSLTDISAVRELLSRHGFRFSKSLGQNFLINPSVCPRMADSCGADSNVGVLEIGPGIGVLTRELSGVAAKVVAIEVDTGLLPVLDETLAGADNVKIIHGDAMKLDIAGIIAGEFPGMRTVICANLPYYITSPLLMRLLESRLPVECITVMVQKEVAQRLCVPPGNRESGAVTLAAHYYSEPELLFHVSRGSFMPAPNVDSAVIRLSVRSTPPVNAVSEKRLFRLIRAGFGQRRKTLVNALAGGGMDKASAAMITEKAGFSATVRAEQLTLEDFAMLENACEREGIWAE